MTGASLSAQTVSWAQSRAEQMLRWESQGPRDLDKAMDRLARRYKLPKGLFWSLWFRPPKRIWADALLGLALAYETERQKQLRKLEHDAFVTAAVAGPRKNSVVAALAVVGPSVGLPGGAAEERPAA